jgi:hypothetical protein
MHMILCQGPIDHLVWIKVDDRKAWQGNNFAGGQIQINAEGLFGGESREGGVSGVVDIEFGGPSQTKNSYLQSQLGTNIPAFRGVVGAVLRRCYLGINPYLKKWAFRARRIHVRQNGLEQWYDAKAEIAAADEVLVSSTSSGWEYVQLPEQADPGYENLTPPTSGWSAGVSPFGSGSWTWPGQPARNTNWDQASVLWLRRNIQVETGKIIIARVRAENGCVVFLNGAILGAANRENIQLMSGEVFDFTLPPGNHTLHVKAFDEVPTLGDTYINLEILSLSQKDMNPAHIIRECLTDPDWGMGYAEADIDDDSFEAAADTLWDEKMGISLLWDRQVPIESFIMEIIKHIDAALYVDRTTGKFVLKLIRADYDPDTLLELDPSNVSKIDNPSRPTFGELTNSVTVNYWNADTGKEASLTVEDTAMIQMQGAVINTTVQYPGFTNFLIASKVGQRDLRTLSTPLFTGTVYANTDAKNLNIGDVFKLTWPDYDLDGLIVRVTGLSLGDGKNNQIKINCTQDVFTTPEAGVISSPGDGWVDLGGAPTVAQNRLVFEAPYYELVQAQGQTAVDGALEATPEIGYLTVACVRPGEALNASVWVDQGSGFEETMALDFCPSAVLLSDVDQMDDVFSFESPQDLDLVSIGTHGQIDNELVRIDAIDEGAGTITVGRGVLDTVPEVHAAGARLYFWDVYSSAEPTEYLDGESLGVKITPTTNQGQLSLVDALSDNLEFNSRAVRPYPPGNLTINGSYFPEIVDCSVDIELAWASRNRVQQTGGTLLDFTDSSVTEEAGTTYTVRAKEVANLANVIYNETGISGLAHTIPADSLTSVPEVLLEVLSVRDGYESWQAQHHQFETGVNLWTPANLSNAPSIWFNDSSPITEVSGALSQVVDLSSNAFAFTQSSASARPVAVPSVLNGRRVFRFDGSNDTLVGPATSPAQNLINGVAEAWSIAVYKSSSTASGNKYYFNISHSTGNNSRYLAIQSSTSGGTYTNRPGLGGRSSTSDSYSETRSATSAGTNWVMALKRIKFSTKTGIVNVNGNSDESATLTNMTAANSQAVAHRTPDFGSNSASYFAGDIAEFIFGTGTLSTDDIDKLFGYLAHRWGLQADLPGGHPYKSTPPTL